MADKNDVHAAKLRENSNINSYNITSFEIVEST